jgi:hypothetical protein
MKKQVLFIVIFLLGFTQIHAQNWNEIIKTTASDRNAADAFGEAVAISGNYAVVSAMHEDEDTDDMNSMLSSGSAYVFEKDGSGNWNQTQKIVALDRADQDQFGGSVAIYGNYIVVGSRYEDEDALGQNTLSSAGSVYIFERDGTGTWNQIQKIVASDRAVADGFGAHVDISGDYILVGSPSESEDALGLNTLDYSGSAYIFERDGLGTWNEMQKIVASNRAAYKSFGEKVTISGEYLVIGVAKEDQDAIGGNSLNSAGAAYIFERSITGIWNEVQKIVASDRAANDNFGSSIALNGNDLVVGAITEDDDAFGGNSVGSAGSAYIFERNGTGTWNQIQKIVASDRSIGDNFGGVVTISGNIIAINAINEDEDALGLNTLSTAGSVYIFKNDGIGTWNQIQKIVASDRNVGDRFGNSINIQGNNIIIGAFAEDEDSDGLNTMSNSGSAYIFNYTPPCLATNSNFNVTECISYTVPSADETYTAVGTYSVNDTIPNSCGEDSVMTISITILDPLTGNDNTTICATGSVDINGTTYDAATPNGTEVFTNIGPNGCDSTVTVALNVLPELDLSITNNSPTLTANETGATYQWIDCDNGDVVIANETAATFTPIVNGNYAIIVTKDNCTDTSACELVNNVGIDELSATKISLYPNPTNNGRFTVQYDGQIEQITVMDLSGRIVNVRSDLSTGNVNASSLETGKYFILIQTDKGQITKPIIITK